MLTSRNTWTCKLIHEYIKSKTNPSIKNRCTIYTCILCIQVHKYASSEETPLPLQIHGAMRSVPPESCDGIRRAVWLLQWTELQCYINATVYILVGKAMMPCSPILGGLHVKLQYTKCLSEGNVPLGYIRTRPYSKQILHCPCSRSVGATGRFSWPHSFATNIAAAVSKILQTLATRMGGFL